MMASGIDQGDRESTKNAVGETTTTTTTTTKTSTRHSLKRRRIRGIKTDSANESRASRSCSVSGCDSCSSEELCEYCGEPKDKEYPEENIGYGTDPAGFPRMAPEVDAAASSNSVPVQDASAWIMSSGFPISLQLGRLQKQLMQQQQEQEQREKERLLKENPPMTHAEPKTVAPRKGVEEANKTMGLSNKASGITCAVCLEPCKDTMVTTCGHVYCNQCICDAIQEQKKCPICRTKLTRSKIHPLYL
eukprot:m.40240 g.40240  ORF g.40240 m.40240 type:complete len:247 (+) comp9640_c1_seq1:1798-2538(+)